MENFISLDRSRLNMTWIVSIILQCPFSRAEGVAPRIFSMTGSASSKTYQNAGVGIAIDE